MRRKTEAEVIGQRVRDARKRLGLSQVALADRLPMEEATVRAIESGRRGLSISSLFRLAKALHLSPGDLLEDRRDRRDVDETELVSLFRELSPSWRSSLLKIVREVHRAALAPGARRGRR